MIYKQDQQQIKNELENNIPNNAGADIDLYFTAKQTKLIQSLMAYSPQVQKNVHGLINDSQFKRISPQGSSQLQMFNIVTESRKACKSVITIPTSYSAIYNFLLSHQNRQDILGGICTIQEEPLMNSAGIEKHIFQFPWPIFNRQFVVSVHNFRIQQKGSFIVAYTSYDYTFASSTENYAIGCKCKIGGFHIQGLDSKRSRVTFVLEVSFDTGCAQMLIHSFLNNQARALYKLKQKLAGQIQKMDIQQ